MMNDTTSKNNKTLTVFCAYHNGGSVRWVKKKYSLSGQMTFGRSNVKSMPDIFVPEDVKTVSQIQGVFIVRDDKVGYQSSPHAQNYIYKSGKPLKAGQNHLLSNGDVLVIYGDNSKREYVDVFCFINLGSSDVLSVRIKERSVTFNGQKKKLLRHINMDIHGGEMVLVLGGSGAGKTTLMNAIMGYEPANGQVTYKEQDIYRDFDNMKYEIGYVPQQDLVRTSDTVYNTLIDAAKMRLPRGTSREAYYAKVEQTLRLLGLKNEQNSRVSKLSGGQKKRLSIALEYIGNPSLFFLDEPDSGLDSKMATELMTNLRSIADQGKIVIVISHSPNRVAELFDKVIVLAKHTKDNCGYLAYFGDTDQAREFFDVSYKRDMDLEGIVGRINRRDEGGDGMGDYFINKYYSEGNR